MKVLFVCSGNSPKSDVNSLADKVLIKNAINQGNSLIKIGVSVDFFLIKEKGIWGYLKSIPQMHKAIRKGNYDIVHAHYSLSAIAATFTGRKNLIVSLMGSDTYSRAYMLFIIRLLCKYRWSYVIVKSLAMKQKIGSEKVLLLPNGVDLDLFKPMSKMEARSILGFKNDKKIVLFAANPLRREKNFKLAEDVIRILDRNDVDLLPVFNVKLEMMPIYMNAADVLLITSLWEGSVNVVKEAMACNVPVVSTDVGDVKYNTKGLAGYFITSYDAYEIADKLQELFELDIQINAVQRIKELGLDSFSVNQKLIKLYESVILR